MLDNKQKGQEQKRESKSPAKNDTGLERSPNEFRFDFIH